VTLNGYNLNTIKDKGKMFALKRGFSGSGNFMVLFKFTPDPPLMPL